MEFLKLTGTCEYDGFSSQILKVSAEYWIRKKTQDSKAVQTLQTVF